MLKKNSPKNQDNDEFDPNYKEKLIMPKLGVLHPFNMVKFPPSGLEWQEIVRGVQMQKRKRERRATMTLAEQADEFIKKQTQIDTNKAIIIQEQGDASH